MAKPAWDVPIVILKIFRIPLHLAKRLGWRSLLAGVDLMTRAEKLHAIFISFLLTLSKFIEMGSLISVMPVVALIAQPGLMQSPGLLNDIYILTGSPSASIFIAILAITAIIMIVAGNISEFLMLRVILFYTASCEGRLAKDLMKECMNAPYTWHAQNHSVSLTRLFQTEVNIWSTLFLRNLLNIFNHTLTITIGVVMVISLAAAKAIIALFILGVVATLIMKFIRPRSLAWARHQKSAHEAAVLSSSNLFTGSKDFKFSENQTHLVKKFIEHYDERTDATAHMHLWGNLPARVVLLFGQVAILLVAVMLWLAGDSSAKIMSQMAILLLITSRVIPATTQIISTFNSFWTARPWIENIHSVRQSVRSSIKNAQRVPNAPPPPQDWKTLTLDQVYFSYSEKRGKILDNVSLALEFGKHYGFVGPSGSGKSSLIDLISSLQRPNCGSISVDGLNLRETNDEEWRKQIGYVSQSPFFADDTIRNNIAYGYAPDEIDDPHIWQSLALAEMDNIVRDLPEKLETRVGEQGIQFSGGQRQRLAIARALYKRPRVLILDEATSALDSASENKVLSAVQGLAGRVLVLNISHRSSAVAGCDAIFHLDDGHLTTTVSPTTPLEVRPS